METAKHNTSKGEQGRRSKKRPYRHPQLVRFGQLSDLTHAVSNSGAPDGGYIFPQTGGAT